MPLPPRPGKLPWIAIIIDDIGYDAQIAEKFIGLNAAITLSILPHSPHQREIVRMAREKGLDLMLHLPMEPLEYPAVNPGPGALMSAMTPDALIRQLNDDLDAVPYIKGVNNHMGSRLTASSDQMNQILSSIKKRDLFFIDSRTTTEQPGALIRPAVSGALCRTRRVSGQCPGTRGDSQAVPTAAAESCG